MIPVTYCARTFTEQEVGLMRLVAHDYAGLDAARFRRTCYPSGQLDLYWTDHGSRRLDREHKANGQAIKNIYVYPLVRDARKRLCSDSTR